MLAPRSERSLNQDIHPEQGNRISEDVYKGRYAFTNMTIRQRMVIDSNTAKLMPYLGPLMLEPISMAIS
ncbi:MAG: hypothetical protein C4536_01480 [Actinobacteria bacterium]|nr:MAG: hypothetical protein C4536_01480 [Actinomycetota bacterium]